MYKQIIVIRKLYPDGEGVKKIRSGKMAAQAAHASMLWLSYKLQEKQSLTSSESEWLFTKMTKIIVGVDTEEEILSLQKKAKDLGLHSFVVIDSGFTEFNGKPTVTALAIGPNNTDDIDILTKDLPLL